MDYTDNFNLQHNALKKIYVTLHLLADFTASLLFVLGSILFLYPTWIKMGTWFFIIGSLFFLAKPTLKLVHSLHLKILDKKLKSE